MKPHKKIPPPDITETEVLAYLQTLTKPATTRQIAHGLNMRHHGRRLLPRLLAKLESRGEVDELHGLRFRVTEEHRAEQKAKAPRSKQPSQNPPGQNVSGQHPMDALRKQGRDPNLIAGRLSAHRDGYGFVIPDQPIPKMDGDLFIPRDRMGDAMNGDRVLARVDRRHPDGRAEGRIVQIAGRAHPTIVGLFRYGPRGNVVQPYDTRIQHEIVIPPGEERIALSAEKPALDAGAGKSPAKPGARLSELDGAVVNVQVTRFPKGGLAPSGRVIEILGRPGEIGVDVEIMIRKHLLPHEFPADVLAQAAAVPQEVPPSEWEGRRDFRHLPIVTIDGETARDFDDAVYVERRADGGYQLQVHIADVAHYIRRGSPLDHEARLRGTSVYFPNRAVPMLPEALSNGICSLKPYVDRLVMSVVMEFSAHGGILSAEFTPGVMRSAERMTYTNVNKVIEGDPEALQQYAALAPEFRKMKELALLLNARRNERGSIDFDLPEPVIEFDDSGRMLSIVRSERNIAHRLIEEFMLAANEAVARYLEKRGITSLHRVHEKPDPKRVLEFEDLAKAFGYTLGVTDLIERRIPVRHGQVKPQGRDGRATHGRMRAMEVTMPALNEIDIRPQHYQDLTKKIAGKPEERILSYLMLRSLRQARYLADPLGHFALAAQEYTHFTSPIRRYPDLIVHRALKWALENPQASPPHTPPTKRRATGGKLRGDSSRQEADDRPSFGPYSRGELSEIATESSESERRADGAERDLMDWKTAQFMESRLGDEYDALIISVQKFGFFVELLDIFVEGLVGIDRIEEFTGERCFYREQDRVIVSQRRKIAFHLGDRVRVRAERIDPFRHRVEFALLPTVQPKLPGPGTSGAAGKDKTVEP
jgi:ribonuclease R